MKSLKFTGITGAVAVVTLLGMSASMGAGAATTNVATHAVTLHANIAAKKTIVCYKGKAVRHVVAVKPVCPKGWTTKKPAKSTAEAFHGTYNGTIALLWSASDVKATAVTGTGTGVDLGLSAVRGTGTSTPTGQTDPINGSGVLSGAGGTLNVKLATSSSATAGDTTAPTSVIVSGTATITGGTGKFAGATGTLKVSGSFNIKSTTAGTNETDNFSATLIGSVVVK
jgi:hypothetical protein